MSVLSNSTHFNLSNTSTKFIELTISADQNSSFRIHHNSSNIMEIPRKETNHASYASWLVDSVSSWTKGSSMQMVKINIPAKDTVECDISCTGALDFNTRIKDKNSRDHNEGQMIVPPENQGCELHVLFTENKGLGYTSRGDVAIGLGDISTQQIIITTAIKTMDGHSIEIHDNIPASCKGNIK